jgi:P pilus assembly chaperone PapD
MTLRWAALFSLGLMAAAAHAQFAMVPQPVRIAPGALQASQALNERA